MTTSKDERETRKTLARLESDVARLHAMPEWDDAKARLPDGTPNWQYRAVYWYAAAAHYRHRVYEDLTAIQREADALNRKVRELHGELLASAAMQPSLQQDDPLDKLGKLTRQPTPAAENPKTEMPPSSGGASG